MFYNYDGEEDDKKSKEIKTFLMGYSYAITHLYNHPFNQNQYEAVKIDTNALTFDLWTNTLYKIKVAVNRGISPIGGRVPYLFKNPDESTFDIAKAWVDDAVWENCISINTGFQDDVEVRFSLEELLELLVKHDGLNYDLMRTKI